MQPEEERKEKVKLISLYDKKRNCQDKFILSLKLLGEGKYGKVYKAVHADKPDVIFAVKVIELVSEKVRKQCLKELEIVKHLPPSVNLVKIHQQHLESQKNLYIFEEYCDGGNMAQLKASRKGKMHSEDQIFQIFFQIISGFLDMRKAGVFHEDIKPQNILKKNNLLKFTDFGISQLSDNYETSIVRKGTLSYMPPEKLKSSSYIPTSKSEIFSLGVTLYEIIFNHHPYLAKRVTDYRVYLKEITNAKLRSVDELKSKFPEASIRLDRLIRIILRMLDLSEGKRLSLQELEDYVKNSQPFKSMKIVERIDNKESQTLPKKYDIIAQSRIFVKDEKGLRESMKLSMTSSSVNHEILKMYMQLVREISSFLLQGMNYAKRSNIFELKKNVLKKQFDGDEPIQRIDYLQFLINFYNDFGFTQLARRYNQMIYLLSQQEESVYAIENDVEFIKNEFLKVFMDSPIKSKKQLRQFLKDKENAIAVDITRTLKETFQEINCVRVNFKDDLLAVLFLKNASFVVSCLKNVLENCLKAEFTSSQMASTDVEKTKAIMASFNNAETEKRADLAKFLEQQMKGQHQMLYDIQTNSDDFEVLQFQDDL